MNGMTHVLGWLGGCGHVTQKENKKKKERKGKKEGKEERDKEIKITGQYVVSDTRCPALSDCELE